MSLWRQHLRWQQLLSSCYLGDAELTGSQLALSLVQLLGALGLCALQQLAALHHGLHL